MKTCPECNKDTHPSNRICQHCGYDYLLKTALTNADSVRVQRMVADVEAELRRAEKECEIALKLDNGTEWQKANRDRQHLKNALATMRRRSATDPEMSDDAPSGGDNETKRSNRKDIR